MKQYQEVQMFHIHTRKYLFHFTYKRIQTINRKAHQCAICEISRVMNVLSFETILQDEQLRECS